ncbi:MAG: hypothetical protein EA377_06160 [Phycisphaerales bacterium]|nr:MAG: hypothetical protein EA377_06160 [Phycisphaerales bacterium]
MVIELLETRMDVVLSDGNRVLGRFRHYHQLPIEPAAWVHEISNLRAPLRRAVEKLNASGLPARVLYRSPTLATSLTELPVANARQAIESAKLTIVESLSYSAMSATVAGCVIGRDKGGVNPKVHTVVTADREDVATALAQLVTDSGLKPACSTPIEAAQTARVLSEAMRDRQSQSSRLHIGEHASLFLLVRDGALRFCRRINFGIETLAATLTRPISIDQQGEPIELDFERARSVLGEFGLPDRDAVIDEERGICGSHIFPLLQPVLQRFIVELRQSLRFGVSDEERDGLTIRCTGPGSLLHGLVPLIQEEMELPAEADHALEFRFREPGSPASELVQQLRQPGRLQSLSLEPTQVRIGRRVARVRRGLLTGTAAALLVIGLDTWRYEARLGDARQEVAAISSHVASIESFLESQQQLHAGLRLMEQFNERYESEMADQLDLRAILQDLSRRTPASIQFTSVRFQRSDQGVVGTLGGFARQADPETQRTHLRSFVDELQESPLFESVTLGGVQMTRMGGTSGEQFEARVKVATVPHRIIRDLASAAEGGHHD